VSVSLSLLCCVLATTAPAVEPQPPPTPTVRLDWTAPSECPTREEVEAQIAELVGRPLGEDPNRILDVRGVIVAGHGGYTLSVRTQHPDGAVEAREFSAKACRELGEPAAVVVAIAVGDPPPDHVHARAKDPPTAREPVVAPAPPTTPAVAPTSPPPTVLPNSDTSPAASSERESAPLRRWSPRQPEPVAPWSSDGRTRLVVGVSGGLAGGSLPRLGAMMQGSLGVLRPALRFDFVVAHAFRRELSRAGSTADFALTVARPELCARPGGGDWRVPLCAGPEFGVLRARGTTTSPSTEVTRLWMALVAGPGLVWAPHPVLAFRLRAELVVSPARRGFTIDTQPLFTTRAVGGRGTLGLEIWLP